MVEAFKECFYTHLRDSKYLINAFADLLGRRSSIDDRIKNCWREIFLSLTESVIPKLRMLANPKIGRDVCDRLERAVGEVVSLVSKGNELARTLLDGATSASDRDKAEEGFIAAVNKLHGLLFKDQEDSVWKALSLLRTDLNLVVNRVLERFRPDLDSASIVVDIANPYELLVFGQRTHVYTAISNLVENVCTRAFKQAAIGDRRCSIRVALAEGDNTVRLAVLDNGCGVGPSLRHGGGLSTVEDIALYLCQDWDVQSAKDGFSTEAYLTFYVLEESSRS
jgi:signal transduction histidine kinase